MLVIDVIVLVVVIVAILGMRAAVAVVHSFLGLQFLALPLLMCVSLLLLLLRVLVVVVDGGGVVALIAFDVIGLIRGFVVVCGCFAKCVVW